MAKSYPSYLEWKKLSVTFPTMPKFKYELAMLFEVKREINVCIILFQDMIKSCLKNDPDLGERENRRSRSNVAEKLECSNKREDAWQVYKALVDHVSARYFPVIEVSEMDNCSGSNSEATYGMGSDKEPNDIRV
jgi:hypothetical protein